MTVTTRALSAARGWRTTVSACAVAFVVGASVLVATPASAAAQSQNVAATGADPILAAADPLARASSLRNETDTPSPTPADTDAPTPSPTPTASNTATVMAAVSAGGTFKPGSPLQVTARIDQAETAPSPQGTVTLRVGSAPLASEELIEGWLTDVSTPATLTDVATVDVGAIAANSATDVDVSAPASNAALQGLTGGVYPVQIAYTTAEGTTLDNTVLTVTGTNTSLITMVLPIVGPPSSRGLLSAEVLQELTASGGSLTGALTAAQQSNAILAVDPAVIASMRALGGSAPSSVQAWLTSFDELSNDMFLLPFADADIATLVEANNAGLAPTSLTRYLAADRFADLGATPSPSPSPGSVTAPTTDELLAVAGARTDIAWPATNTATEAVANWAVGGDKTLMLSSGQLSSDQAHVTLAGTGADALVYDADYSVQLTAAAGQGDAVERNSSLNETLAVMSVDAKDRIFLALERNVTYDAVAAGETVVALSQVAGGRLAGEVMMQMQEPVHLDLPNTQPPTERAAVLNSLLASEPALADIAIVLEDPTLITGAERAEILQLFSTAWLGDPTWDAQVEAHRVAVNETLNAVEIEPLPSIQFLSSGSSIPLRIRNDLPFDATLKLWAQPDDFRLTVESPIEIDAAGGAVSKVLVPVTAGLGNGDVTIRFWLTAADGQEIGQPMSSEVFVRAEWEKFGIIGLISLVALLVIGGIWRTIRKRRKARAAETHLAGDGEEDLAGHGDEDRAVDDASDSVRDDETEDGAGKRAEDGNG